MATVDVLGEEATSRRETQDIVRAYHDVFEAIERERLDSNVSVKLTALGLNLAYELCRANLFKVVSHAAESGNFVRIDMEDSTTTSDTLELYRELRAEGHENVGIVLQAATCAGRSATSTTLAPLQPNVRLVKGIYVEPPLIAYREYEEVRGTSSTALHELLQAGSYAAIATHDELLIEEGKRLVTERGLTPEQYEFQMLLGVRELAANRLVEDGHRLRIYVPFGEHWYRYSLRRLQENPKIAGYVASDTVNRLFGADGDLGFPQPCRTRVAGSERALSTAAGQGAQASVLVATSRRARRADRRRSARRPRRDSRRRSRVQQRAAPRRRRRSRTSRRSSGRRSRRGARRARHDVARERAGQARPVPRDPRA